MGRLRLLWGYTVPPKPLFEVDPKGLAEIQSRRDKVFLIWELVQNALDADGVTKVEVFLRPMAGRAMAALIVQDDAPDGFEDLKHAYTLFAQSPKKQDPTKRGMYDWGEKLVISMCRVASICTTKGTVTFGPKGRTHSRTYKEHGSVFSAEVPMTREEYRAVERKVSWLIPPKGVMVFFNDKRISDRIPMGSFKTALPTVFADDDGLLHTTRRQCVVRIHEPRSREKPHIYEMGIPVCEFGGGVKWHVDVQQRVPGNMERNGVTAGYRRTLRVHVLNAMYEELREDDASEPWARDAADDKRCSKPAIARSLDLRFGERRAAQDPSDPEAGKRLVSEGYTLVGSRQLSQGERANAKKAEALKPAGQISPTPKPYSDEPGAPPVEVLPESDWPEVLRRVVEYAKRIHQLIVGGELQVKVVKPRKCNWAAAYGSDFNGIASLDLANNRIAMRVGGKLDFNWNALGSDFFKKACWGQLTELNDLLIHEFAHAGSMDHLSAEYHEACTKLGARLTDLALSEPKLFEV